MRSPTALFRITRKRVGSDNNVAVFSGTSDKGYTGMLTVSEAGT